MALNDILNAAFQEEEQSGQRLRSLPTLDAVLPTSIPGPPVPSPENKPRLADLLPLLLAGKGGQGMGAGGDSVSIDPSLDLMTRHGVTLDEDAMRSLIQARRAGFNPFPFIGSSYRSYAEQAKMYANRAGRSIPVAPPGQSLHQQGIAFDAGNLPADVRRYLLNHGWFWGSSFGDPVHYSYGQSG